MQYRKRPVVIEAEIAESQQEIETLEGVMVANAGDYIVTGVKGERYPVKPDIFALTYERVEEEIEFEHEHAWGSHLHKWSYDGAKEEDGLVWIGWSCGCAIRVETAARPPAPDGWIDLKPKVQVEDRKTMLRHHHFPAELQDAP